jgi:hypothetical protein
MIEKLTSEEEAAIIIEDIFQGDNTAKEYCLKELAELRGLNYDSLEPDEVIELIIENEDDLYSLHDQYIAV